MRFKVHLRESKYKRTKKEKWIFSLIKKNEYPIIEILDNVEGDGNFFEIYWIEQFKVWGFSLLNGTIGGDGSNGFKNKKHSKETLNKLKDISNEYFSKIENRQHISSLIRLKYKENPLFNSKKVIQYDLEGNMLKKTTINEAHKELNIPKSNITECCKGRRKTAGKFIWKYEIVH